MGAHRTLPGLCKEAPRVAVRGAGRPCAPGGPTISKTGRAWTRGLAVHMIDAWTLLRGPFCCPRSDPPEMGPSDALLAGLVLVERDVL